MDFLVWLFQNRLVKKGFTKYLKNGKSLETKRSIKVPHFHRINTDSNSSSLEDVILEIRDDFPFSNPLVLADPKTYEILGDKVYNVLEKIMTHPSKIIYTERNLTEESVENYTNMVGNVDCIYAVGGGTVLDLGKSLAYKRCSLVNVPTALTNDGIASCIASIRTPKGRVSKQTKYPNAIVCDYSVLKHSPKINAGIGDAIAKYVSVEDWKLANKNRDDVHYSKTFCYLLEGMALGLMIGINELGKDCLEKEQYIDVLLGAFMLSAAAMSNTGGKTYPASGAEHALSHAADMLYPDRTSLHGEQCGVFTILAAYLHKKDWKIVRRALKEIGAPTTLRQIQIEPTYSSLKELYNNSKRSDRYTILNETKLEDFVYAAKKTGITD